MFFTFVSLITDPKSWKQKIISRKKYTIIAVRDDPVPYLDGDKTMVERPNSPKYAIAENIDS